MRKSTIKKNVGKKSLKKIVFIRDKIPEKYLHLEQEYQKVKDMYLPIEQRQILEYCNNLEKKVKTMKDLIRKFITLKNKNFFYDKRIHIGFNHYRYFTKLSCSYIQYKELYYKIFWDEMVVPDITINNFVFISDKDKVVLENLILEYEELLTKLKGIRKFSPDTLYECENHFVKNTVEGEYINSYKYSEFKNYLKSLVV